MKNGTFDLRKWRTKIILYLSVSWRCIFHDLQSHYLRLQSEVFNLCTTIVRDRAIYYYRQCRWVIITWRNLHLDRLHVRSVSPKEFEVVLIPRESSKPDEAQYPAFRCWLVRIFFFPGTLQRSTLYSWILSSKKKGSLIRSNSAIMHFFFVFIAFCAYVRR